VETERVLVKPVKAGPCLCPSPSKNTNRIFKRGTPMPLSSTHKAIQEHFLTFHRLNFNLEYFIYFGGKFKRISRRI
jgi:hypothetical protein